MQFADNLLLMRYYLNGACRAKAKQGSEKTSLTIAGLRVSTKSVTRLTFLTQVHAISVEVARQAVGCAFCKAHVSDDAL